MSKNLTAATQIVDFESGEPDFTMEKVEETEETEEQYPMLFGKFLVLDRLTQGGMAKICLSRYLGGTSDDKTEAEKLVSLKMVLPEFSTNKDFKKMFLDEVKIIFGLTHPNIVQTYDYGLIKDQLFISMEFIEGANLQEFMKKLKAEKKRFGVDASVHIIKTMATALYYAHTYKDKLSGKEFNLIHRDISPDNIMITFDGNIKLIDFGIAKSDAKSEITQTGTIKGKPSYFAPEYLTGDGDIDARYDQFALGLVLWEMLTNKQTFDAKTNMGCLTKIIECDIAPPSKYNKYVDEDLDKIIMKSLSKEPEDRYKNMEEFNRVLSSYLNKKYPDFHQSTIKKYAQVLFKDEISNNSEKFLEYGKINPAEFVEETAAEMGLAVNITKDTRTNSISFEYEEEQEGDVSIVEDGESKVMLNMDLDFEEEYKDVVYEEDLEAEKEGKIIAADGVAYKKNNGFGGTSNTQLKSKNNASSPKSTKPLIKKKKAKNKFSPKFKTTFIVIGVVLIAVYAVSLIFKKEIGIFLKQRDTELNFESKKSQLDLKKDAAAKEKRKKYLKQFEL
jgi:serine/threonine protein kinase